MGKDPAFLFYPGDYLRDTQCLSPAAQVAYDRIMCEHMRNICISHAQLKFFTKRLTDDEREEVMAVLKQVDGCFQIEWVAESICKRKDYSRSRSENRKGKPKDHMLNISSSYDNHMENENENENESVDVTETGIARIEKKETAIAIRNDYTAFVQMMQEVTGREFKGCEISQSQFAARIKDGYTMEDFRRAATNAAATDFHREKNLRYLTPEFITRPDKLETYRTDTPAGSLQDASRKINRTQTVGEVTQSTARAAAMIEAKRNQIT